MPPLPRVRAQLVAASRRLHAAGWVANHDGNLSLRLNGNRLLITPTATSKAEVDDASLIIVDLSGKVLEGRRKAFSELELHLAVYRARPDVEVVVHAHPPYASAFALVGAPLSPVAMPEVVVSLGEVIPTLPRTLPKSSEGVAQVEAAARRGDVMLLGGNGALTTGADLSQALLRMELVEHYAKVLSLARAVGPVAPLAEADLTKLREARRKAGLGPPAPDDKP